MKEKWSRVCTAIFSRSGIAVRPGSYNNWLYVFIVLHSEMAAVPWAQICLFPLHD